MALVNKFKSKFLEEIKSFISKTIGAENTFVYTQLEKDTQSISNILTQLETLKFQNANLVLPKGSGRHYKIESNNIPKTAHANIRVRAAKNGMKKYEVWFMKVNDSTLKGGAESVVEFDFIIAGENPVNSVAHTPIVVPKVVPVQTPPTIVPVKKGIDPCSIPKGYTCVMEGDKYICTKMGGGAYESKYLKYKNKYIQLKNQLNL